MARHVYISRHPTCAYLRSFCQAIDAMRREDPTIVTHVVLERLTDLVWNKATEQRGQEQKDFELPSLGQIAYSQRILQEIITDLHQNAERGLLH